MNLDDITPLVITFNEAPNIGRTLEGLRWARQIIVLDSYSSDETLEIAASFPQVRVVQRAFDSFANQCNFGLTQVDTPWVLSLDADYVVTEAVREELHQLAVDADTAGFRASFRYCIQGVPLRGTLYPPRTVLYRKDAARYVNEGHGHRVVIDGAVRELASPLLHDDRKPLGRWLESQRKYAAAEAGHLRSLNGEALDWPDRLRKAIWPAAPAAFFYTLFVKRCLLDGWPGWFYALQRTYAELLLSLELLDGKLSDEKSHERP